MTNNENGRSMVEMLGVLAIIGVLSVAGIAGYTTAMRAYRANEIVQAASLTYAMGRASNGGLGTGTVEYDVDVVSGSNPPGATDVKYTGSTSTSQVVVSGLTTGDCNAVRNKVGTTTTNPVYTTTTADCTSITITFNNS